MNKLPGMKNVSIKVAYYRDDLLLDRYEIYGTEGESVTKALLGSNKYRDKWGQIPKLFPSEDKNLLIFVGGDLK